VIGEVIDLEIDMAIGETIASALINQSPLSFGDPRREQEKTLSVVSRSSRLDRDGSWGLLIKMSLWDSDHMKNTSLESVIKEHHAAMHELHSTIPKLEKEMAIH
jgi:hypothetical protein